jgi:hypothetical protein
VAKTFPLDHSRAVELLELLKQVHDQKGDYLAALEDAMGAVESWVEWTAEPERVIFRKFPHDGAVIALFPDQLNERTGAINSYMELGQHAETAPDFGDTKPAEPHEYHSLLNELEMQGYLNLRPVKRFGKLGRK